ncbi:hypothetical protein Moror_3440 [Moniliophthora roreri MCA 2997]|uniref:Uncharacterized protein n=2 Tax=Moniliophthora roreri TaxID=221103 RepID=V2WZ55_MONRO|nr:hypothetical protein Moror_3440 [Moniliophthora roreri MCA 2997]
MPPGMFEGATDYNITGGSFQNFDGDQYNTSNTTTHDTNGVRKTYTTINRVNKATDNDRNMNPGEQQYGQRRNEGDYLNEYDNEDEPNDESVSFAPGPEEWGSQNERRRQHYQAHSQVAPAHSGDRDRSRRNAIRPPQAPAPPARRDNSTSQSQYDNYQPYPDYHDHDAQPYRGHQRGANKYHPRAYDSGGYSSSSRPREMHYDPYADPRSEWSTPPPQSSRNQFGQRGQDHRYWNGRRSQATGQGFQDMGGEYYSGRF